MKRLVRLREWFAWKCVKWFGRTVAGHDSASGATVYFRVRKNRIMVIREDRT